MLSCKSEARGRDGEPRAARRAALPIATNMKPPPRRIRVGRAALLADRRRWDAGWTVDDASISCSLFWAFGRDDACGAHVPAYTAVGIRGLVTHFVRDTIFRRPLVEYRSKCRLPTGSVSQSGSVFFQLARKSAAPFGCVAGVASKAADHGRRSHAPPLERVHAASMIGSAPRGIPRCPSRVTPTTKSKAASAARALDGTS